MLIGLLIITGIIFIKYRPVYRVTLNGETIGYIENKNSFEDRIDKFIDTKEEECIAFKTLEADRKYELEFVNKEKVANEDEAFGHIIENTEVVYTMYAILVNEEISSYVETESEAQNVVNELNEKYENQGISIGLRQIYSTTKQEVIDTSVAVAQISTNKIAPIVTSRSQATKRTTKTKTTTTNNTTQPTTYVQKKSSVNGITFTVQPVSGKITSKFGARGSGRSGSHTGLDIATSRGTSIRVVAAGTVVFSQKSGSYGNLIKISHGNGVETWYAHCDSLYAKVGEQVSAGQVIAAVGSTGNSTGPHLHLEIRINGKAVNPQIYMY